MLNRLMEMNTSNSLLFVLGLRLRGRLIAVAALMWALSIPASALDCETPSAYQDFVETNYPMEIAFDVFRNDKLVGEHVTRFRNEGSGLSVESRMALTIKLLFITAYEFEYRSVSEWCGNRMVSLDAYVNGRITVICIEW